MPGRQAQARLAAEQRYNDKHRPKGLTGTRAHAARKAEQEAQGGEESGGSGEGVGVGGEAGGGEGQRRGEGRAAAAAVLAADPLDDNGVPRSQMQEEMGLQRVRGRDAREAELEAPGATRLAGAGDSCDPSSLSVEEYGGGSEGGGGEGGEGGEGGGGGEVEGGEGGEGEGGGDGGESAATPLTDAADQTMVEALRLRVTARTIRRRRWRLQHQRLAEVPGQITTVERAQLTEALEEGEQAVAELQQGGSPADASRIMSLQQKVALGTFAKQRLAGDAHASLTGGKALRTLDFERLFSDAPMLPLLVGRELPAELQWRATKRGIGCLVRWRRDGPAAQASRVADAMTRAAHMPDPPWRSLLGKRTREAAGLPGKLSEYEWQLRTWEPKAELSEWQHERCEARRRELEECEAHVEGDASTAAEAEGAGDEGECTICKEPIEGDAGALGCAERVEGKTSCAGRFCAACLPETQKQIVAGNLRSCPNCRSVEPSMGQAGAGASLRLCRNFVASSTENAFESIALPPPPPPRDESAGEAQRLQGEDDAQMAARLQQEEQAAWVRGRRHRQLEESDARTARETAQEQARLLAQRSSAAAQRDARGAEGGTSTAAVRLQREADASALGGGAAGGGASSSPSSPDATSAAPQSTATPPHATTTPNAATPAAAPQHDAATHLLTTTSEGTTFGGADRDDAALDADVQPGAGNPSPNHTPATLPINPIPYPKP